jgi:hypothetical protein
MLARNISAWTRITVLLALWVPTCIVDEYGDAGVRQTQPVCKVRHRCGVSHVQACKLDAGVSVCGPGQAACLTRTLTHDCTRHLTTGVGQSRPGAHYWAGISVSICKPGHCMLGKTLAQACSRCRRLSNRRVRHVQACKSRRRQSPPFKHNAPSLETHREPGQPSKHLAHTCYSVCALNMRDAVYSMAWRRTIRAQAAETQF